MSHISLLGVMLHGIKHNSVHNFSGESVQLSFAEPVAWNMWYFRTADHSPELDPTSFCLEENEYDGGPWRIVASSSHLLFMSTRTFFHGHYPTSTVRNSVELFDLRSDTGRYLQLLNPAMVALFVGLSCLCGVAGIEERGRQMLSASLLWCTISNMSSAAWYLLLCGHDGRITGVYYACGAANHGLAFFLVGCLAQERLQLFFGCFGTFFLGWASTLIGYPYDGPYSSAHWALALGAPTFALAVGIQLSRWWIVAAANRLVRDDRRCYDAMWADVCAHEPEGLAALSEAAEEARLAVVGDLRQYRPMAAIAGGHAAAMPVSGEPETCLLALRGAAARADPLLRAKVAEWSAATGGLHLQDRRDSSGPHFAPIPPEGSPQRNWVRWAEPKRAARAAEKAVRAYGGDVSRLTDLARQSIAYQTTAQLAAGIRAVARDPEVAVARVKNRLCASYDAAATAGYRDVIVNLRIRSADAFRAGVAEHVCEVKWHSCASSCRRCRFPALRLFSSLRSSGLICLHSGRFFTRVKSGQLNTVRTSNNALLCQAEN